MTVWYPDGKLINIPQWKCLFPPKTPSWGTNPKETFQHMHKTMCVREAPCTLGNPQRHKSPLWGHAQCSCPGQHPAAGYRPCPVAAPTQIPFQRLRTDHTGYWAFKNQDGVRQPLHSAHPLRRTHWRTYLVLQWLVLCPSNTGGEGLTPVGELRSHNHAMQPQKLRK